MGRERERSREPHRLFDSIVEHILSKSNAHVDNDESGTSMVTVMMGDRCAFFYQADRKKGSIDGRTLTEKETERGGEWDRGKGLAWTKKTEVSCSIMIRKWTILKTNHTHIERLPLQLQQLHNQIRTIPCKRLIYLTSSWETTRTACNATASKPLMLTHEVHGSSQVLRAFAREFIRSLAPFSFFFLLLSHFFIFLFRILPTWVPIALVFMSWISWASLFWESKFTKHKHGSQHLLCAKRNPQKLCISDRLNCEFDQFYSDCSLILAQNCVVSLWYDKVSFFLLYSFGNRIEMHSLNIL